MLCGVSSPGIKVDSSVELENDWDELQPTNTKKVKNRLQERNEFFPV